MGSLNHCDLSLRYMILPLEASEGPKTPFFGPKSHFLARRIHKKVWEKAKMTIFPSFWGIRAFMPSKGVIGEAIRQIKSGKSAFPPILGLLEQLLGPKYTHVPTHPPKSAQNRNFDPR